MLLRDFDVWKLPRRAFTQSHLGGVPLLWLRSACRILRIKNFRRREDGRPAPTLWLDNEREDRIRLEGLSLPSNPH